MKLNIVKSVMKQEKPLRKFPKLLPEEVEVIEVLFPRPAEGMPLLKY